MRIIILDDDGDEQIIECVGAIVTAAVESKSGTRLKHIHKLSITVLLDGMRYQRQEVYVPIAKKIIEKFQDGLKHINPERIRFIEDLDTAKKDGNRPVIAQIKQVHKTVYELTGYMWEMTIYMRSLEKFSDYARREKILAALYKELRRIEVFSGKILDYEVKGWSDEIATLGTDWDTTMADIPNILNIEKWDELPTVAVQMGFLEDRPLKAVR